MSQLDQARRGPCMIIFVYHNLEHHLYLYSEDGKHDIERLTILPKMRECRVAHDAGGVPLQPSAAEAVALDGIPSHCQLLAPLNMSRDLSVNVTSSFNLCIT